MNKASGTSDEQSISKKEPVNINDVAVTDKDELCNLYDLKFWQMCLLAIFGGSVLGFLIFILAFFSGSVI